MKRRWRLRSLWDRPWFNWGSVGGEESSVRRWLDWSVWAAEGVWLLSQATAGQFTEWRTSAGQQVLEALTFLLLLAYCLLVAVGIAVGAMRGLWALLTDPSFRRQWLGDNWVPIAALVGVAVFLAIAKWLGQWWSG